MIVSPYREGERRAVIDGRRGPDAPPMALDDALYDGKTDAGAFEVLGAVQSLKYAE